MPSLLNRGAAVLRTKREGIGVDPPASRRTREPRARHVGTRAGDKGARAGRAPRRPVSREPSPSTAKPPYQPALSWSTTIAERSSADRTALRSTPCRSSKRRGTPSAWSRYTAATMSLRAFDARIRGRVYDERRVGGRFAAYLPFFGVHARVWQERGSRRQNVGEIRIQEEDCLCVAIECRDRATADRVELRRVAFGHGVHQPPAHPRLTCVVPLECHDDASSEEVEECEVAEREHPSNSRDRSVLPMGDWKGRLSEVEMHDVGGAHTGQESRAIHVTPERPVPVPPEHHVRRRDRRGAEAGRRTCCRARVPARHERDLPDDRRPRSGHGEPAGLRSRAAAAGPSRRRAHLSASKPGRRMPGLVAGWLLTVDEEPVPPLEAEQRPDQQPVIRETG